MLVPAIIYGLTITLYLAVRRRYLAVRRRLSRKQGAFDLGRLELPVAIGALVWSLAALFALVTPSAALVPVLIVIGLLLVGGLFLLGLLIFDHEKLETEPGDVDVFKHSGGA